MTRPLIDWDQAREEGVAHAKAAPNRWPYLEHRTVAEIEAARRVEESRLSTAARAAMAGRAGALLAGRRG